MNFWYSRGFSNWSYKKKRTYILNNLEVLKVEAFEVLALNGKKPTYTII